MPLNVSAGAGSFIDDFVHSKNKRFKGKSKEQRIKMALGAYYKKKRSESNSKVLRVLNDIELAEYAAGRHAQFDEWISGRSVVSSDPPRQGSSSLQPVGRLYPAVTLPLLTLQVMLLLIQRLTT